VSLEPVLAWRDRRLVEVKATVRDLSPERIAGELLPSAFSEAESAT
jgi:hypothetical protein